MKIFIQSLVLILILSLGYNATFAQDPISSYPGIPLIVYPNRTSYNMVDIYPNSLNQLEQMGVYGVVAPDVVDNPSHLQAFSNHNLKVIPQYLWGDPANNSIWRYTNSHYTVWEAEGTDLSNGKATLYHNSSYTYILNDNGTQCVSTNNNIPINTELINGPGYSQNVTYNFVGDIVDYTAEFRLKMVPKIPNLPNGIENDVVCTLIITNQKDGDTAGPGLVETIYEHDVTIGDLIWNDWDTIKLDYNYINYLNEKGASRGTYRLPRASSYFVQYKIIWGGLPYLDILIDRIRVYDDLGLSLMEEQTPSFNIENLVQQYLNNNIIVGWYGTDEPGSIDNYEPFRVVDEIISNASNNKIRLHSPLTGGWRGTYASENWSYGMAHDLYVADEFWLRAKPKNIQLNAYMYHNPWDPGTVTDWKERNIALLTESYFGRINDYDPNFSVSTQGGAYYYSDESDPCTITDAFEIPTPFQINYNINLALLYGAKELRLDPYFSGFVENCNQVLSTYGLIDPNEQPTDNYLFFKKTIIPDLSGLYGNTLKTINQVEQYPNLNLITGFTPAFGNYYLDNLTCPSTDIDRKLVLDAGIFEEPGTTAP